MKKSVVISNLIIYIFILFPSTSFSFNNEQVEFLEADNLNSNESIYISTEKSTLLYCSKAAKVDGTISMQPGENMTWEGNAKLEWEIQVSSEDIYEAYLIANVREEGAGSLLSLMTDQKTYEFKLSQTNGPYIGGRNFERVFLSAEVALKKGDQKFALFTENILKKGILLDIRAVELLPVSAKERIDKEKERAEKSRASFEWLNQTGYGLMFHWTSQSVQPNGHIKKYEDAVNDFDVEQFADMVDETGAGYVIFTIGHAESYCPAPIKSWEKIHPGHTTERDFIEEMANALSVKGVQLICYINGPLAFKFDTKKTPGKIEQQAFVNNFKNILSEMGNRYMHKVAGYWFDSWYQIFEGFPDVPFEKFNKVAKTGNKDRIICLNSWIYPAVTPWQDYWAGEVASPIEIPENGYMKNGPVPDLPYQALLIMEPYWVQQKAEMPEPRFSSEQLSSYIQKCMENGGAVTINMGIYQNGTVGEEALEVMRQVKANIRKVQLH